MTSVANENNERTIKVELTENELRYLVAAGFGLLQHIPQKSLTTYVNFSAEDISNFSKKIRSIMDQNNISM